jgi:Rab-GTPase-TBC domain
LYTLTARKISLSTLTKTPSSPEFVNQAAQSLKHSRKSYFDISYSGELFVYGGLSSAVYVWNLFEKRLVHEILLPSLKSTHLIQISFLGNSNILAVLSANGDLVFINAMTAEFVAQLKGKQPFQSFCVSPDGQCLSTVLISNKHIVSVIRLDQVFHPDREHTMVEADVIEPIQNIDQESITQKTFKINGKVEKKSADPPKTFFELVESREESSLFNKTKLRRFLNHYGTFPDKYRHLIWRYLLQLPENRAGYEALLDQGLHPSYSDFRTKYPLKSDRAAKSMEKILSCLAYWSPIFEDLEYLPSLVYPFVKLFCNDLFSCLEVVMTILMNWCQKWWEYYPNPPVEALEIVSSMLEYHDPQLFSHFERCEVSSQIYAWDFMKSLFSESFSKQDWLKVWDHLVANPPSFLYHFMIAYLIHFRKPLLAICNQKDFIFFFQKRNATNTNNLIMKAYEIKQKTPTTLDPSTFLKSFNPCLPGEYPIFNQYPQFIVNHQMKMKNKIREDEEEFIQKRLVIGVNLGNWQQNWGG